MKQNDSQTRRPWRFLTRPFLLGGARALDLFGVCATRTRLGPPIDDWQSIARDFQAVGKDIETVLAEHVREVE